MRAVELWVDVETERAALATFMLEGQWVDFCALLAIARTEEADPDAYVTAEALARVGPWRYKKFNSVGKEVARKLDALARRKLGGLIDCKERTRAWRLTIPASGITLRPSREAVRTWLVTRTAGALDGPDFIRELVTLVDAAVAFHKGDAEATLRHLDRLPSAPGQAEPALEAWAALLRGRAAAQFYDDDDDDLSELYEAWALRADAPGRAVSARLRALLALKYRFQEPEAALASLGKLAADLELRGDIGSVSAITNVMGLLARRADDPQTGAIHHLRAAALSGISGDSHSLQATLYNLAICRREALRRVGLPPDEAVLTLVDLCRKVCAHFGVGCDSALGEISGAEWALERGDIARAQRYLEQAEALVEKLDSTYDQACFREVRAYVELAARQGKSDPITDLHAAEALFRKVGDEASAHRVRAQRASLESAR